MKEYLDKSLNFTLWLMAIFSVVMVSFSTGASFAAGGDDGIVIAAMSSYGKERLNMFLLGMSLGVMAVMYIMRWIIEDFDIGHIKRWKEQIVSVFKPTVNQS